MTNISDRLYISTTADNAAALARSNGFGLEITEFCTAYNLDDYFEDANKRASENMRDVKRLTFHAPFNELTPAAIDPLILEVTRKRFNQAYDVMQNYGIKKMIAHSGFMPHVYYEEWFIPRSVEFWREFLSDKPCDFVLCLENVLEASPDMLIKIASGVNDNRLKLCFDAAHAKILSSEIQTLDWARKMLPLLGHVHIHNNNGQFDTHNALGDGIIDFTPLIELITESGFEISLTIESIDAASSISWLKKRSFI